MIRPSIGPKDERHREDGHDSSPGSALGAAQVEFRACRSTAAHSQAARCPAAMATGTNPAPFPNAQLWSDQRQRQNRRAALRRIGNLGTAPRAIPAMSVTISRPRTSRCRAIRLSWSDARRALLDAGFPQGLGRPKRSASRCCPSSCRSRTEGATRQIGSATRTPRSLSTSRAVHCVRPSPRPSPARESSPASARSRPSKHQRVQPPR